MSMKPIEPADLYTLRWYAREGRQATTLERAHELATQQYTMISTLLGEAMPTPEPDDPIEPPRPNPDEMGQKQLIVPWAKLPREKMRARGRYRKGYPEGLVLHWTAGRYGSDEKAMSSYDGGVDRGHLYFLLAQSGLLIQGFPLDQWGYHAGTSSWKGLPSTVSDELVGLEVINAGKLDRVEIEGKERFAAWFHYVPGTKKVAPGEVKNLLYPHDVRQVAKHDNQAAGFYHRYTDEQEEGIAKLCLWLKLQAPDIFQFENVVGHDEVAPGRKTDPGGSLSMSMPEFRAYLEHLYQEVLNG